MANENVTNSAVTVNTKMHVVANKKLQEEIDAELKKKDQSIASVLPNKETE